MGDYLSEDTLWEITTCWQDALSSKDIEIDDVLLQSCAGIVEELANNTELNAGSLESMAEAMAKFVICSTENIEDEPQRLARIDESIVALLSSALKTDESVSHFENHCVYLEALQESTSAGVAFDNADLDEQKILPVLRRAALNFTTICKLVCRVENPQLAHQTNDGEDELTEDYCDPNANLLKQWSESLILEILQCMKVASIAETWMEVSSHLNAATEELVLCLSEQIHSFMGNSSELVDIVKERMTQAAVQQNSVISCHQLGYLIHYSQYAAFEESATILLHEDLAELFVSQGAPKAYVMTLQVSITRIYS